MNHDANYNPRPPLDSNRFRVTVGHTTIRVDSDSPESAIREARRRLCDEMPRMWDVIHRLSDCRFEVLREEKEK